MVNKKLNTIANKFVNADKKLKRLNKKPDKNRILNINKISS